MLNRYFSITVPSDYFRRAILLFNSYLYSFRLGYHESKTFFIFGPHPMVGGKLDVVSSEADFEGATHCLVSALVGKRIHFGIGILTKRICYYPLLLVNRYFLTNDYYSPISTLKIEET